MFSSGATVDGSKSSISSDPFLLEFGSSVSVNEDLSRELHKSCQGLDASMQNTNQEIQRASRTDCLLKKDLGHATAEMTKLARDCAEEVDAITINRHTRTHLLHQFQTTFVRAIDPKRLHASNNNEEERAENAIENTRKEVHERTKIVFSFAQVLSQNQTALQNFTLANRQNNQKLSETRSYRKEISQNSVHIEECIASSEKARDEAQVEKHARTRELNVETQRLMSLKDACHRSRNRCGQNAKDLAELDKFHSAKQSNYKAEVENIFEKILHEEEEIKYYESKELAEVILSLSTAEAEIEELQRQINTANEIRERRLQREAMTPSLVAISTEKEQQALVLEEARAKLSASITHLAQTHRVENELSSLKSANDEREAGQIACALLDRSSLGKEKELCAGKINELLRERKEHESHRAGLVTGKKEENALIEQRNLSLREENAAIVKGKDDDEKKREELITAHEKEIKSYDFFISSLEEAIEMKEQQRKDILEQREAEKDEKIAKTMDANSKIRQEAEYKLSVLRKGAEALRSTEEKYQETIHKPFDPIAFVLPQ
mmetsp:Transcript_19154/g.27262  ORF Transcript_19154/g.27262 Transcript_19154/m.27262 type:complete len:553 (-) Transcript_19154:172-1830(-)